MIETLLAEEKSSQRRNYVALMVYLVLKGTAHEYRYKFLRYSSSSNCLLLKAKKRNYITNNNVGKQNMAL